MKKILFFLILFSHLASSYDVNSISKLKNVWQDFAINLNHQFSLMAGFGRVDAYLCMVRNTEYKDFSNLKNTDGSSMGYLAKLDEGSCGQVPITMPWTVKSEQSTTNSPLNIEMINYQCPLGDLSNCLTMINAKLSLVEEDTVSNPYGILTFDYFYGSRPDSNPLYLATYESKKVNDKIEFDSAIFVDALVINPSVYPSAGQQSEFYSAKIIHTPGAGGEGTVKTLNHRNDGAYEELGYQSYPDGNPTSLRTTNFVYDNDYVLYRHIDRNGTATDDRCIDKKKANGWNYVPTWFGYGIYDANGDRLTGSSNITINYTGPIQTKNNESWSGNIMITSGSSIGMPYKCKKVKDGTHWSGDNMCPGIANAPHIPVEIDGEIYENFPLLDIPEGTVLTDASNNEYYIRQLRPRIVYAEASLSQCATLTVGSAKQTNDHTFFNYPVLNLPRVGAVLVNKLSNEPSKDIAFNGNKWIASEDDDSDGILNSLDMFPINALKNKDVDFDGIEDSEDGTLSEFQFNWTKYLDKSMFSAYEKDKLN